jgi:hypothetical protein
MAKLAEDNVGKPLIDPITQQEIIINRCKDCNHFALQFEMDGFDGVCFHEDKKLYIKNRHSIDESCRLEDVPDGKSE